MRVHHLLMTIPLLLGLGGAAPASAQGLVEYALILVMSAGPNTVIDDFQVPSAMEDECRFDPGFSPLCGVLDEIVDMPAGEAIATLHRAGALLEDTETLDARGSDVLMSDGCAETTTGLLPGTYTVQESPPPFSRDVQDASTLLGRRSPTRSSSDRPTEEISLNFARVRVDYTERRRVVPESTDTFTYTISDGFGGEYGASRARPEPTRCIDRIQSELSRTGEMSIVSDVMNVSETDTTEDDVVVFVYSVINE